MLSTAGRLLGRRLQRIAKIFVCLSEATSIQRIPLAYGKSSARFSNPSLPGPSSLSAAVGIAPTRG
jgi:hypothetical protein